MRGVLFNFVAEADVTAIARLNWLHCQVLRSMYPEWHVQVATAVRSCPNKERARDLIRSEVAICSKENDVRLQVQLLQRYS